MLKLIATHKMKSNSSPRKSSALTKILFVKDVVAHVLLFVSCKTSSVL